MRDAIVLTAVLVFCAGTYALGDTPSDAEIGALKAKADEVLKLDTVSARPQVEFVFKLAEALRDAGRDKESIGYYEAALRIFPLALEHQLHYAQLLMKNGSKDLAVSRARIVATTGEEDALVIPALELLGKKKEADTTVPPMAKVSGKGLSIVLVPMGEVDILLLKELRESLQRESGATVLLQRVDVTMPAAGRAGLSQVAEMLRENLQKNRDEKAVQDVLKDKGLALDELKTDDQVLGASVAVMEKLKGKEVAARFEQYMKAKAEELNQWEGRALIAALRAATQPYKQENVRFLGVLRGDIYTDENSFLFGFRIDEDAVLSYRRFIATYTGETPNRTRLLDRTLKQALSSVGHVLGLPRCSDPQCARAYPNSVAEQDAKSAKLCDACQKAFKEAMKKYR